MEKLIKRAVERIINFGDGFYLVVSLPKEYNEKKLKRRIKTIAKKYALKKENIIIGQDIEGNIFDIPIAFLMKRKEGKLNVVEIFTGY